jgi:two-component system NtrC family sensor kinase
VISSRPNGKTPLTESDFQLIAESIPHVAWTASPEGYTDYFNRLGREYTGCNADEGNDCDWLDHVYREDVDRARHSWDDATYSGTSFAIDCRLRRYDGQYRWHAFRGLPVRWTHGEILKWIGTATDIDDQKRLEEHFRLVERQAAHTLTFLETLQSTAPLGFGLVDLDFKIVRINEPLAAVSGRPVQQHLGRRMAEMVPELWAQLEPLYRRTLDDGIATNEVVIGASAADPERVHRWLTSCYPVCVGNNVIGVGVVVIDITPRPAEDGGGNRRSLFSTRPQLKQSKLQILRLMSEGYSNREIAGKVHLSENTVKSHIQEIFRTLEVRNRVEAVLRATREGWI